MVHKPFTRANAKHNFDTTIDEVSAAINLLKADEGDREALKGLATAMPVTETNSGRYDDLSPEVRGRRDSYTGVFQMGTARAKDLRNTPDGKRLRAILQEEEAKPPHERNADAQLLLNGGATAGVWSPVKSDPYQYQGVLGALSTIYSADIALEKTGKQEYSALTAAETWIPHKLGNGAVLGASEDTPLSKLSGFVPRRNYRSNFGPGYDSATAGSVIHKTEEKFYKKVAEGALDDMREPDRDRVMRAIRPSQPDPKDALAMELVEYETLQRIGAYGNLRPANKLNKDQIFEVQNILVAGGYDVGASGPDGKKGPRTNASIHKYNIETGRDIVASVQDGQGPKMIEIALAEQDRKAQAAIIAATADNPRLAGGPVFATATPDVQTADATPPAEEKPAEEGRHPIVIERPRPQRPYDMQQIIDALPKKDIAALSAVGLPEEVATLPEARPEVEQVSATQPVIVAQAETAGKPVAVPEDSALSTARNMTKRRITNAELLLGIDDTNRDDYLRARTLGTDASEADKLKALSGDMNRMQDQLLEGGLTVKKDGLAGTETLKARRDYIEKNGKDVPMLEELHKEIAPDAPQKEKGRTAIAYAPTSPFESTSSDDLIPAGGVQATLPNLKQAKADLPPL